jgi:soluble lytic murein transglycosylase-like protein
MWILIPVILMASCTTSHNFSPKKSTKEAESTKEKEPVTLPEVQALSEQEEANVEEMEVAESPDIPADATTDINDLKLSDVAAKLRVSEKDLRGQIFQMDRYLRRAPGWKQVCFQLYAQNKQMCDFVKALQATDIPKSDEIVYPVYKSRARIRIKPEQFSLLQKVHYRQLMSSIEKNSAEQVLAWAPRLVQTRGCPRNLSAAAIRKMEMLLPSDKAQKAMESLYEHAAECLEPQDYAFEPTHLRQGLLRMSWGDEAGAKAAFVRSTQAKRTFERRRTLFWAGLMAGSTREREVYWSELTEQYPLTFHALEVWRYRSEDPFLLFTQKPYLKPSRFVGGRSKAAKTAQEAMHWLEAMHLLGKRQAAALFVSRITKVFSDRYKAANIIYLAQLKEAHAATDTALIFLNRQVSNKPEVLNQQTLKMLFPKPYFDLFQKATEISSTDPYLLLSVARQESSFNPMARSPANARGLMQILPSTARQLSGRRNTNLYSPEKNVHLGAQYMAQLISRFGSVEKALAAYNAGPNRVVEWERRYPVNNMILFMDLIPFRETRNYVSKILCNNYWYEKLYATGDPTKKLSRFKKPLSRSLAVAPGGKSKLVSRLLGIKGSTPPKKLSAKN